MAITFTGYTDLNEGNGWIPEPGSNEVLAKEVVPSAVESAARKVNMTSRTVSVPRFAASGVDVVPEHNDIPLKDAVLDEVVLTAVKWADRHAISVEDREDAIVDELNEYKKAWISNFHVALDNACLGTTGTANGTTRPFESVYQKVGSGRRLATAGELSYEDLVQVVGDLENSRKGGLVVIAHPSFKMALRNLKDANGDRVVSTEGVLGSGVPTVFGHEVQFSYGAVATTTATDTPTGNPLMVVAAKNELILGVRKGVESLISDQPQWVSDHVEIKMRARYGFVLADTLSAYVIEKTASA
jgi:HK97 family phage major capsid protein